MYKIRFCNVRGVACSDEPIENYQQLCSSPQVNGAYQQVSAHCLAVWPHLFCFGSLSLLSQCCFRPQQSAVFRKKTSKTPPTCSAPMSDGCFFLSLMVAYLVIKVIEKHLPVTVVTDALWLYFTMTTFSYLQLSL